MAKKVVTPVKKPRIVRPKAPTVVDRINDLRSYIGALADCGHDSHLVTRGRIEWLTMLAVLNAAVSIGTLVYLLTR